MIKKIFLMMFLTFFLFSTTGLDLYARRGASFGSRSFSSSRSYGGYSSRSYSGYRSYGGYSSYGGYRSGGVYVYSGGSGGWIIFGIISALIIITVIVSLAKRSGSGGLNTGVIVKLQVAFYADKEARIQKEIIKIGESANTSSPEGLQRLLNSVMIFLGRNIENVSHCYYKCSNKANLEALESQFESEVSKEKMKYKAEYTDQNYKQKDDLEIKQHVVLTTLVATNLLDFSKINSIADQHQLRDVVNKLAGIPSYSLFAVEVIITPANEQDALSRETLEMEYPELKML